MEQIKFYTGKELKKIFHILERHSHATNLSNYQKKLAIRNEAMFKIMYYCGLRVSEMTEIETCSYDTSKSQIYCTRKKGGLDNTLRIIDENIIDALNQHISFNQPEKYMFTNFRTGNPISRKTCDRILRKICKEAKIPPEKWHCHVFRHTRAVDLAELGLDTKDIQFWLGHVDIKNTYVYFRYTTKQEKQLYRKMKKAMKKKQYDETTAINLLKDSNNSIACLQRLAQEYSDLFALYMLNKLGSNQPGENKTNEK